MSRVLLGPGRSHIITPTFGRATLYSIGGVLAPSVPEPPVDNDRPVKPSKDGLHMSRFRHRISLIYMTRVYLKCHSRITEGTLGIP